MKTFLRFPLKLYTLSVMLILLSASFIKRDDYKKKSADWQILHTTEQLDIKFRYGECQLSNGTNNENVYLQVTNKTKNTLEIEWDTEYWYNGKCNGCAGKNTENHKSIILNPMETREGTCSEKGTNALKIFSKMLGNGTKSELTDFYLRDIEIKISK